MAKHERQLKDAMYGQLARVSKALSSPRRIELIEVLAQHPRTVEDLAKRVGQTVAATSHHLQALRTARLVETVREAQFIRYQIADRSVLALLGALRETANARLTEIEHITREVIGDTGPLAEVSRRQLLASVKSGKTILLDVRPTDEYEYAHLRGAKSVPISELESRLSEFGEDADVVAYCRGPYCLMAADAVALLQKQGVCASRLEDGVVEWSAAGLPLGVGQ